MAVERFVWTEHAESRRIERRLGRSEIENAIRDGHFERLENDGRAQWLVQGRSEEGRPFEAIYDSPHEGDPDAVRIVSVWQIDA